MTEPALLDKILQLHAGLSAARVPHAFAGTLALARHVERPCARPDLELATGLPAEWAADLLGALPAGVRHDAASERDAQRDGHLRLQWGRTTLDVHFPRHLLHHVAAGRTVSMALGGALVPVLSATDLAVMLALSGRTRDWADVEDLVESGAPNLPEALAWLTTIAGATDVRTARLHELAGLA